MLRNLSPAHIMVVVVLLVLLFGWKKLPDMARSLGRSARVFKSEVDEMRNDGKPQGETTLPKPATGIEDRQADSIARQAADDKIAEAEARLAEARAEAERLHRDQTI
jgi:sec-independent protein translocase protein TatA